MSFIKTLSRLANLKYFPLVLSLILIIPFTPLEIPTIYGGDYINKISVPYRKGGVKTLSFLTGFTLLPIISSSHFLIISDDWSDPKTQVAFEPTSPLPLGISYVRIIC